MSLRHPVLRWCLHPQAAHEYERLKTQTRWIDPSNLSTVSNAQTLMADSKELYILHMTESTENVEPSKSTKSRNSNSSVQIQIKSKLQFECVPRDTEKSECLDLVDLGHVGFSVQTAILLPLHEPWWRFHKSWLERRSPRAHPDVLPMVSSVCMCACEYVWGQICMFKCQ